MDRHPFRRKRSDTKVGTIEAVYQRDLGVRSDMKLGRLLRETGRESLTDLIKYGPKRRTPGRSDGRGGRRTDMAASRVFTSFDYDHDLDIKTLLVGQSKLADSPFELADWSVRNT